MSIEELLYSKIIYKQHRKPLWKTSCGTLMFFKEGKNDWAFAAIPSDISKLVSSRMNGETKFKGFKSREECIEFFSHVCPEYSANVSDKYRNVEFTKIHSIKDFPIKLQGHAGKWEATVADHDTLSFQMKMFCMELYGKNFSTKREAINNLCKTIKERDDQKEFVWFWKNC